MSPCPKNDYFNTLIDPRYKRLPGEFALEKQIFEEQNGMTGMFSKRYTKDEAEASLVRQVRKEGTLKAFSRPTLGWKMACELDSSKLTREEVYD